MIYPAYCVLVEDSDGYESFHVVETATCERDAKRIAKHLHMCECHSYTNADPEAAPYAWATIEETVTA